MLKQSALVIALFLVYCSCCLAQQLPPAKADLSNTEIREILRQRIDKYKKSLGIVVGIISDKGSRIISYGKMGEDDSRKPDRDTIYEIGSITKVFTTILLADMAERGEVSLSDPISKFLPKSVKVPTKDGREITLIDLATHTSGLPRMPYNMAYKDAKKSFAHYSVDQMYQFLSNYTLPGSIGAEFEYSNFGMGLLGHILALKAGMDYETLVITGICEPLKMNSTQIKLSHEIQTRLAAGHDESLKDVPNMGLHALAGAGALRSTANDLLRFLAANLGLVESGLTPVIQQTHIPRHNAAPDMEMGMGWYIYTFGTRIMWHSGGTWGYRTFIGFDKKRRTGVVVLSNSSNAVEDIGFRLLGTIAPWAVDRIAIEIDPEILNACVGVYETSPGIFRYVTRFGDRLFLQRTGGPKFEIFPETETDFFIKDTRIHLTFIMGNNGKATRMILWKNDGTKEWALKVDRPLPEEKRAIELDPKVYDAYVGHYQIEPDLIFTITKEDDRLMAQLTRHGKEMDWQMSLLTGKGKEELFSESETRFFYRVVDAEITFVKDERGKVTHLILHQNGDRQAKKID